MENLTTCKPSTLVASNTALLLSKFITHLNNTNTVPPSDSVFRCVCPAPITFHDYAVRLGMYMQCSAEAFVVAAVLIDRVWSKRPDLFCELSSLKLMCTSAVVAAKFLDDGCFPNSYYANCGGVSLPELNTMEREFLTILGHRVFVSPSSFDLALDFLSSLSKFEQVYQDSLNSFNSTAAFCSSTSKQTQTQTSCVPATPPSNQSSPSFSDEAWNTVFSVCEAALE